MIATYRYEQRASRAPGTSRRPKHAPATRALGLLLVAVSLLATGVTTAVPAHATGDPLAPGREYDGDFPDPFVIKADGVYYAYGTNTGGVHVPVLRSLDLRAWYVVGDSLPKLASWAEDHDIWSPEVIPIAGRYVMYYAAPVEDRARQCISYATASSPIGPFVDTTTSPLVCDGESPASIDPSPFVDKDGRIWILWKTEPRAKSDHPRIWVQELTGDGTELQGERTELLFPTASWEGTNVEAPAMRMVNGVYVLMYSGSAYYSSKYNSAYAVCAGATGPCTKWPVNPFLQSVDWMRGPGGGSFFNDKNGHLQFAYHYWTAPNVGYPRGKRRMRITEIMLGPFGLVLGDTVSDLPPVKWSLELSPTKNGDGYLVASANGAVDDLGNASFFGSVGGFELSHPVIGMDRTPSGDGYWLVANDGGIFAFGDAEFFGSTGGMRLNKPIVGMASTPTGNGYWLVASDGGMFTFGDAQFFGSTGAIRLNQPIVGMAPTPTGNGYWFVASDGGIFSYGDAEFFGSMGGTKMNAPITAIAAHPSGRGYWLLALDGGVFSFGTAPYRGAAR